MNEERKTEEFEDDRKKWKIYFDIEKSPMEGGDTNVLVSFVINRKNHDYLTEEDCLKYNETINFFSDNSTKLKVIILSSDSTHKGRGCICGCNSVIVEPKKELLFDLTGWNLAHEFGHIFGLSDLKNRWNLMCDEFKIMKPKFLNKEQFNSVSQKVNSLCQQPPCRDLNSRVAMHCRGVVRE